MRVLLPVLALAACSPDDVELDATSTATDAVDVRRDFPDPPEGGQQWLTPDYVIPAYTEKQWCLFTTYEGPTVGIHGQWSYQSQGGHHVVLMASTADEDDVPDGTVLDCTADDALPMTELEPLVVGGAIVEAEEGVEGEFVLPEGMATQLKEGQRIVVQSHYVNYTSDDLLVNDAINLEVVDPDAVETWAAPFVHVQTDHPIPQGDYTLEFDCGWEEPYELLFIGGHMHEYGTSFQTTMTRAGATEAEVLYEVGEWDPLMRDAPPFDYFDPGEMRVEPGDLFTTRCNWHNDSDHVLDFPEEMCVTIGMVYPSKVPLVCSPD